MTIFDKNLFPKYRLPVKFLWWVSALSPLLIVLSALFTVRWSWWIMDDLQMLLFPGNIAERVLAVSAEFSSQGRFFPMNVLRWAALYRIFEDNPRAFYFFRYFEIILALGVWAWTAFEMTRKKESVPMFLTVAAGFYAVYDHFFHISLSDVSGILFTGAGMLCVTKSLAPYFESNKKIRWMMFAPGFLFLMMGVTSKESFLSLVFALGASLIVVKAKDRRLAGTGLWLILFSAGYALWIKVSVMRAYSANYAPTWETMAANFVFWLKQTTAEHGFWILPGLYLFFWARKKGARPSPTLAWARSFSLLAYGAYLVFLLPWNTGGYYIAPLAVLFALAAVVFLADALSRVRPSFILIFILLNLCVNVHVATKAVGQHSTRQIATTHLLEWLAFNDEFRGDVQVKGVKVGCNMPAHSYNIPRLANYVHGTSYPDFAYAPNESDFTDDRDMKYYIWTPYRDNQIIEKPQGPWSLVFLSHPWYVYKK